jgi:ParB-like nuclease domain
MSNIENLKLPAAPNLEVATYENLIPHELANLLPMIEGKTFEDLKADISKRGILEPIVLFEGRILDGRNRHKAAKEIGYKFTAENFKNFDGDYAAAEAWSVSTQFLRRQLTGKQRNDFIAQMIRRYPDESNRQIARRCGINSHSQVANVRDKMSEPSEDAKKFKSFCRAWDDLPEHRRHEFVKTFAPDIGELLAQ